MRCTVSVGPQQGKLFKSAMAGVLAFGVGALPFVTAVPLTLAWTLSLVGIIVVFSGAGFLNLRWARQLRGAGWNEEDHLVATRSGVFYLSDLLLMMWMFAVFAWSLGHFEAQGWLGILSSLTGFSDSL